MRAKLFIALSALLTIGWAVPNTGTAPFIVQGATVQGVPATRPVRLRISKQQGLLLSAWINGRGPYTFAVDTGAGMNLIAQRVVDEAQLASTTVRPVIISGLTGARTTSNREAVLSQLALGDRANAIRGTRTALVVPMSPGIDGILDPTDIYAPLGYSIDMPNQLLAPAAGVSRGPLRRSSSAEGAVVPWVRVRGGIRPFVRLGDGRLALIDTGSGFGLAVNSRDAVIVGSGNRNRDAGSRDIGGQAINSRRVSPTTISIGELVLQRVPTDILFGVEDDVPVILGRDVLYPFKITFDPQRRLIEFVAAERS